MSKFNELSRNARYIATSALSNIFDGKHGIAAISKQEPSAIAQHVGWCAADWMTHSFRYQWANWAMLAMSEAIIEALESAAGWDKANQRLVDVTAASICDDAEFCALLEEKAEGIIHNIAAEALRKITCGAEFSSNPMTIIQSSSEVESARYALERLCGLERYMLTSYEAIKDLFEGKQRRHREENERRRAIPRKISVGRHNGFWLLLALNGDGESIDVMELKDKGKTKSAARAHARAWAEELRLKFNALPGGCASIDVEG